MGRKGKLGEGRGRKEGVRKRRGKWGGLERETLGKGRERKGNQKKKKKKGRVY